MKKDQVFYLIPCNYWRNSHKFNQGPDYEMSSSLWKWDTIVFVSQFKPLKTSSGLFVMHFLSHHVLLSKYQLELNWLGWLGLKNLKIIFKRRGRDITRAAEMRSVHTEKELTFSVFKRSKEETRKSPSASSGIQEREGEREGSWRGVGMREGGGKERRP